MTGSSYYKRLTKEQREEILRLYADVSPDAAQVFADKLGLAPSYAYKLAHERGIVPRVRKYWQRLKEQPSTTRK
jgi:hypothetical protein